MPFTLFIVSNFMGDDGAGSCDQYHAPFNAAPMQNVVITGSGFSATPANLNVWFDHVKGTIVQSSAFSIEVQVPAQARFSNIEVVNLTNHLTVRSALKFLPSFGGADFDATKVSTPFTDPDLTELFDIAPVIWTQTVNLTWWLLKRIMVRLRPISLFTKIKVQLETSLLQSLIKPICRFWTFPRPQQTLPVAIWMAMASQRLSPPGWGQPETKYLYCATPTR